MKGESSLISERRDDMKKESNHPCSSCINVSKDGKPPLCDLSKMEIRYPQIGPMICKGYVEEIELEELHRKEEVV